MKKFTKVLALIIALLCVVTTFMACTNEQSDDNKEETAGVEYYITYKGTKIELDKNAESALSALGAPKNTKELASCGDLGSQVEYTYDDIVIYTLKNDNGETIDQISFTNDIVETQKGICIGDTSEDVIKAHGTATTKTNSLITYTKACDGYNLHLKFSISDGEVTKINFMREFVVAE